MSLVVKNAKRLVVKVGSSLVTNEGRGLDREALATWARQIVALKNQGREIVLVSSGAITEGMQRLGWKRRPHAVHQLQAAAAVGQMGLIQVYESCFREHDLVIFETAFPSVPGADATAPESARVLPHLTATHSSKLP